MWTPEELAEMAAADAAIENELEEARLAKGRAYRQANKARIQAYAKEYYKRNREKMLARSKAWYQNNRERADEMKRQRLKRQREASTWAPGELEEDSNAQFERVSEQCVK